MSRTSAEVQSSRRKNCPKHFNITTMKSLSQEITHTPFASLIIAVYKNIHFLELVLCSVNEQTYKDFEVIVAEDNDDEALKKFIEEARNKYGFPIQHVYQEDKGFRKNKILNQAVIVSRGEYLHFIDGDSLLNKNYLLEFTRHAKQGYCLFGRRAYLDEMFTNRLLKEKKTESLSFWNILLSKSEKKLHALYMPFVLWFQKSKEGIWGCSMGLMKEDLMRINGFDEDYVHIGVGEDHDIEWRLLKTGIKLKSMKYRALQYHLHHPRSGRESDLQINYNLMEKKINEGIAYAINGLSKK